MHGRKSHQENRPKQGFCQENPGSTTIKTHAAGVTQLVECQPSKLNVAGSTPVARFEKGLFSNLSGRPFFVRGRCPHLLRILCLLRSPRVLVLLAFGWGVWDPPFERICDPGRPLLETGGESAP